MFNDVPLSAAASALKAEILAIPVTFEALTQDLPDGLSPETVETLHYRVLDGDLRVVPELKKLIARFPACPTLGNYLRIVHQVAGKRRQADQALQALAQSHPDYLFTRLGLAEEALDRDELEQVPAALGPALDLRALYPARDLFHVIEVRNFYRMVGIYHARSGAIDAAHGVRAALEALEPDSAAAFELLQIIMRSNLARFSERMRREEQMRIKVKTAPLAKRPTGAPAPAFEHPEIDRLYRRALGIPLVQLRELLALPRESLVRDLIRVLEDGIVRTPDFMKHTASDEETCAPFHALQLLAELRATESLGTVLRFLELHPDALRFWLGDFSLAAQFARLVAGDLPRCAGWLKSPGIGSHGKSTIADGMVHLARLEPQHEAEVLACLEDVFRTVLTSPPADNLFDTRFLSLLVCNFLELGAAPLLPLITEAYAKGAVEKSLPGDLAEVTREIAAPLRTNPKDHSLAETYQPRPAPGRIPSGQAGLFGADPYGLENEVESEWQADAPAAGAEHASIGRNDPCPCRSGKKFKKCCGR